MWSVAIRITKWDALTPLSASSSLPSTHSGFSGVSANFFPWVIAWLCGSKELGATNEKREKVQEFLSVGDRVIAHKVLVLSVQ